MSDQPRLVIHASTEPADETPLVAPTLNYDPDQERDEQGRWSAGGGGGGAAKDEAAAHKSIAESKSGDKGKKGGEGYFDKAYDRSRTQQSEKVDKGLAGAEREGYDKALQQHQGTLAVGRDDVKRAYGGLKSALTKAGFKKTSSKTRDIGRGGPAATVTEERWARGKKSYVVKVGRGKGPKDNWMEGLAVDF